MKPFVSLLLFVSFFSMSYSQTVEQRENIINSYNKEVISEASLIIENLEQQKEQRVREFIQKHPNQMYSFDGNGNLMVLEDVYNNEPIYISNDNFLSAITIKANSLYNGGSLGLNIQGQGMTVGVWEIGSPRITHQEFQNNDIVFNQNDNSNQDQETIDHATHVIGTITANGIQSTAKGIAFDAEVRAYTSSNALTEVNTFASDGYLVSNHSYGLVASSNASFTWRYGGYSSEAWGFDLASFAHPNYLYVVSAGNDRESWSTYNPSKNSFELLTGEKNAKNTLTVAAVSTVTNYTGPSSVQMSTFSNWGPTDDGRIKPDISAKGVGTYSPLGTSDTSYASWSGTSMASPAIASGVILLQQYYNQIHSSFARSATVKGLVLHTAREAGLSNGPDYRFGWGLANIEDAAEAITNSAGSTPTAVIDEVTLADGSTYTRTFNSTGTGQLRVSLSWTDPVPSNSLVNSGTIDPNIVYLVNDLDVKVTNNGVDYYPWKLDKNNPSAAATNDSTNDVDNFERVDIDIDNPSGSYTITVSHKGTLSGGSQNFTLLITGPGAPLSTDDLSLNDAIVSFYPNPAKNTLFFSGVNTTESIQVNVYDTTGRVLIQQESSVEQGIDISSLPTGNYIVQLKVGDKNIVEKFIKE